MPRPAPWLKGFSLYSRALKSRLFCILRLTDKHMKQQLLHHCSILDVKVWPCQTHSQPHMFWWGIWRSAWTYSPEHCSFITKSSVLPTSISQNLKYRTEKQLPKILMNWGIGPWDMNGKRIKIVLVMMSHGFKGILPGKYFFEPSSSYYPHLSRCTCENLQACNLAWKIPAEHPKSPFPAQS